MKQEARWEEEEEGGGRATKRKRDERVFLQEEEEETCSVRSDLTKARGASRLFSLCFFFFL